jgi:hypothetical protein
LSLLLSMHLRLLLLRHMGQLLRTLFNGGVN